MTAYIALLRGVNVAGKNKLPMRDWAAELSSAGCQSVRTYIQSGNAVFHSKLDAALLAARIQGIIKARFGLSVLVILRTAEQMRHIVEQNRFLQANPAPEHLHVVFLSAAVTETDVYTLTEALRFAPDHCHVNGSELYLHVPTGFGTSRLPAFLEGRLKRRDVIGTTRNWRTTLELLNMAGELSRA